MVANWRVESATMGGRGSSPLRSTKFPTGSTHFCWRRNSWGSEYARETPAKMNGGFRERSMGRALAKSRCIDYPHCPPMASPCKKCGAEKTESVPHGVLYSLAKACGYRLCMCSRCSRLRLFPLPPQPRMRRERPPRRIHTDGCPRCGSTDWDRSRRRSWERFIGRRPMVRCRACRARFPHPLPPPS